MNDTLIPNWSGPEEAPEHEMRSRAQRDSVDGFMQLFLAMLKLRVGDLLFTGRRTLFICYQNEFKVFEKQRVEVWCRMEHKLRAQLT